MINFTANDTAIIKASSVTPKAIKLYFGCSLYTTSAKDSITDVLRYWASSNAIAGDGSVHCNWSDNANTLVVEANFNEGNFCGDLLNHNAIALGDEKFGIGLVRLLDEGYVPKTSRGEGVNRACVSPICIEFIYEEEEDESDDIISQLLRDVIQSNYERRVLHGNLQQIKSRLLDLIKEIKT